MRLETLNNIAKSLRRDVHCWASVSAEELYQSQHRYTTIQQQLGVTRRTVLDRGVALPAALAARTIANKLNK